MMFVYTGVSSHSSLLSSMRACDSHKIETRPFNRAEDDCVKASHGYDTWDEHSPGVKIRHVYEKLPPVVNLCKVSKTAAPPAVVLVAWGMHLAGKCSNWQRAATCL